MVAVNLNGPSEEAVIERALEFMGEIHRALEAPGLQVGDDGSYRVTLSSTPERRLDRAAAARVPHIWNMSGCGGLGAGPICRAVKIEYSSSKIEIVLQRTGDTFLEDPADLGGAGF